MTVKVSVEIVGLKEALRRLETELPAELVGKSGGPVLKALKKSGQMVQKAAKDYVRDDGMQPDRTKNSIKIGRMRRPQKYVKKGEGINIAPKIGRFSLKRFNELAAAAVAAGATFDEAADKILKADEAPWAGVQEFGAPSQGVPAQGFMRRAADSTLAAAMQAFSPLIGAEIDKALAKIARKNKVRNGR